MSVHDTALVVPVPEAEAALAPWRRRLTPSGAAGMPAHVTLLYPFLEPEEVERESTSLSAIAASEQPFRFTLREHRRFPGGVLYLAPEPADPFAALIVRVCEQYPDRPPYDGAHGEVVPHVTVASTDDGGALAEAERAVAAALPLECVATELVLFERVEGVWTVCAKLPLGQ